VYGTARAQDTSYGGLIAAGTTAGTAGDGTNLYFGHQAGFNTAAIGSSNTFTGYQSGFSNTTGSFNTATGATALFNNTTGHNNTANGGAALFSNISGGENTASGVAALFSNTTGDQNTAYGHQALYSNTEEYAHTAIGYQALYSSDADNPSTAVGYQALYSNGPASSGGLGFLNTAIGYQPLYTNTEGIFNTATGAQALFDNIGGDENTAEGYRALFRNTTGNHNTASGYEALYNNLKGDYNVAFGYQALYQGTGNHNIAIGYAAGPVFGIPGLSSTKTIGSGATATANSQTRIGGVATSSIGGYASWTNLSDARFKKDIKENIPGLDFIIQLRPVSYTLDRAKLRTFLGKDTEEATTELATSYLREVGFIAQEVEQLLNENGYTRIGIEAPQNDRDHYTIRYSEFVVPLVKAIQEQQQSIEVRQKRIETLQQRIEALQNANTTNNLQNKGADSAIEGFSLHQNIPNPFDQNTTINAVVPQNVQQAKIVIYNLNGLELERYDINRRGNVSVEIAANRFPSGMYLYALLTDDRVMDTKKMILTK
ncbi:MAG: tail fiber domain-containing protein, partial [Bacteroidota bacterium]